MGGALSAGTVFGWSSPAEIPLRNGTEFGFPISADEWSWVGSTVTIGAAVMCAVIGVLINYFGRKLTMLIMTIPFVIGWCLLIFAVSIEMLYVGRVLLGLSAGSYFIVAPMYIGEIAQKDIRGSLSSLFQLNITIGILLVYALGYGLTVFTFSIVCGIIPIVFVCAFVFMPESPLFLVTKNRTEGAIKSLKWLRGSQYDYNNELIELQEQHEADQANKTPLLVALRRKATIKGLIIMIGIMFFLQFTGINIVIFYTGFIFNEANTGIDPELATILVGVMQVLATFVATLVVDRLGRRILLLISISFMVVCKVLLGIFFYMKDNDSNSVVNITWLPVFALCLYIVVFSLGFGPVPWILIGEIFAPDIKGFAGSAAGTFTWALAFAVTKSFDSIQVAIGIGPTFFLLAGFSVLGTVFIYFVIPETKGKSLAEIQIMLGGGPDRELDTNTTASATDVKY